MTYTSNGTSYTYTYPSYTVPGVYSFINSIFETPERTDAVTLTIKSVQLKAGWVGQLWNGANIVWESKPKKTQEKATKAASKARTNAIARLFEDN